MKKDTYPCDEERVAPNNHSVEPHTPYYYLSEESQLMERSVYGLTDETNLATSHVRVRSSRFTMIELLAVISIIAVLSSILLPALKRARTTTKMVQSTSNVRQLGIGLMNYGGDNNFFLPYTRFAKEGQVYSSGPTPQGAYWQGVMYHDGYVPNFETFFSPGHEKGPFTSINYLKTSRSWYEWRYVGYVGNFNGAMPSQWWGGDPGYPPYRLGSTKPPPSRLLIAFEAGNRSWWGITHDGLANDKTIPFTYNGRLPRVYADGHANADNSDEVGWVGVDKFAGYSTITNFLKTPWYDIRFPDEW